MRNTLIILITSLLFATPVLASMPPKEYQGSYAGTLTVHKVRFGQADATCDKIAAKRHEKRSGFATYGCAFVKPGKCEIVVSYDPTGQDRKMLSNSRKHEIGHCLGWPSNHPGALP